MNKWAAFLLLLALGLAQSPLQEFLKLPVLIVHFQEHKARNAAITFIEYLQHHYIGEHPQDDDYHRDQQLPFRANDIEIISSQVVVPEPAIMDFVPTVYKERVYPLFAYHQLLPSHSAEIWQPPKIG